MAKTKIAAFALLAALTAPLTGPLFAQEADDTATEEVAADAVGTDGLSMGVEVGGGVGEPYVAGTFEAWEQRCVNSGTGADTCQLYMLLKDAEGASVAEFAMFGLPEGTEGPAVAGATFVAPLETLLTAGMMLSIDGAEGKAYPFTVCTQTGCVARLGFTAEEVTAMMQGNEATITVIPFVAPDQKVTLTLSLKGFTAGYEAVNAANAAADAAAAAAAGEAPASP